MKLLLDENFPVALYHRLQDAGYLAEHLIVSGQRGIPDSAIWDRLRNEEDLVLLTHDNEFLDLEEGCRGKVVVSRVHQSRPVRQRVDIWMKALETFLEAERPEQLFELRDDGSISPFDLGEGG